MRPTSSLPKRSSNKAAALIIVLAFVVLLTGLAVAYLSHTTTDRQLAHSSFHDTDADVLARSALDTVVGDFKLEILNGSSSSAPPYVPKDTGSGAAANMVPMRNPTPAPGTTPAIANLIRRSVRSEPALWPNPTAGPAVGSRASAVNSTSDVSANGRSVTLARWNSHYMVPKLNTGDGGSDPITTGFSAPSYWAPDWVFVTSQGPTPAPAPANVIGRYAYAVYDEGGLLDMNAAGFPSPTTILQYGRKGSLAFADLSSLPGLSTAAARDNIVGWRNYASSRPSGTPNPPGSNFSFTTNATNTYYNFVLSDPTNIRLTNYFTDLPLTYFTNSFLTTSQAPAVGSRTDQALVGREELIDLRSLASSGGVSFSNALQSLGTSSREAQANVPQWTGPSPNPSPAVNPNFQTLLVTNPGFIRNDGTTAAVGDPYLNKRFLLQRLNWLTYKGPSATRTIPTSAPSLAGCIPVSTTCAPDYDMWLLTRGAAVADVNSIRFGLTSAFLQQGTVTNVQKYFGLVWDGTNERWNYVGQGGSLLSSIATLGTLTGTREPDFFELLQAGIVDGSIGDSLTSDPALPLTHQQSKMLHILTIGANLIAQSRADSYPVRIACNVGGTTMEAVGMPRLPCLSSLAVCPVGVTTASPNLAGIHWFLIPNLWDPFRDTWDLAEANANNNLSTPGYLRPPVRITVTGNAGFGFITASSQSGSVNPASVTTTGFGTIPTINSSLVLATGNTTPLGFGRDGLLEAKRLGLLDINTTLTPVSVFTPTNSTNTGSSWNDIVRPANDNSTYRSDDFVVYRLSLQGSGIPSTANNRFPVLTLQSGFQVSLEYQSPTDSTKWYGYSFLQGVGKDATNNTWITPPIAPGLCLTTPFSKYNKPSGYPNGTFTIINSSATNPPATLWSGAGAVGISALAQAPMFVKTDPRSIRYNSWIGMINVAASAGILGSIWPSQYTTPPPMTGSGYPTPTPTGSPVPTTLGDNTNAGNGANPYNELVPTPTPTPPAPNLSLGDNWRPVMMNRPFRSVGEMAYAFRDQPFRTLSFSSANSPDAGLLDLFTTNDYTPATPTPTPPMRAGVISLNSAQAPALASLLTSTIRREDTPRTGDAPPNPSPSLLNSTTANSVATSLLLAGVFASPSPLPLVNRAGLVNLIANETGLGASVPKTQRESIARAFGETVQTRTWNLLIDMIAQTGHFKPNASNLQTDFVVEGEQHYWAHVAIDRFTGQVIDTQIEVVTE